MKKICLSICDLLGVEIVTGTRVQSVCSNLIEEFFAGRLGLRLDTGIAYSNLKASLSFAVYLKG